MKKAVMLFISALFYFSTFAQSNWKRADSLSYFNYNDTSKIYRSGNVAISHGFLSPFQNKLLVTDIYSSKYNRGAYFSLNEPRLDLLIQDSTQVGLAKISDESHNTLVANNYANFKTDIYFDDVHNSTAEINYFRGTSDALGFRDGAHILKSASLKIAGNFGNNGRSYRNTEFDLLNLRFFTGNDAGNTATIDNFYGIRLEDFRGLNPSIIKNGWGVYIKPVVLKNYFAGKTGIGTTNITHQLTIEADTKPLKITGFEESISPNKVLTIKPDGEVSKSSMSDFEHTFKITLGNEILTNDIEIYIHKGPEVSYTLPSPNTRTGKVWRITNVGTGSINTSEPFMEGENARNTILNKAGGNSFILFSDGTQYIAIK